MQFPTFNDLDALRIRCFLGGGWVGIIIGAGMLSAWVEGAEGYAFVMLLFWAFLGHYVVGLFFPIWGNDNPTPTPTPTPTEPDCDTPSPDSPES